MKRLCIALLALCVLLSACSGAGMLSGKGKIEAPSSGAVEAMKPEFPSAEEELPAISEENTPSEEESSSAEVSQAPSVSTPPSSAPQASVPQSQPAVVPSVSQPSAPPVVNTNSGDEVRAVWVSYLEFLNIAKGKSKREFTASVSDMFETCADYGLNTVFVQVRPFGDALYESSLFPWSYVLTDKEGEDPGYDPLDIMIELARENGLGIEAWINPYRVRAAGSSRELSYDNPALIAVEEGDRMALEYNGGVFYNPASADARELIAAGVRELLEDYDIDGIHFDDYFYPTTDSSFDSKEYKAYQSGGGTLSQADWRRQNVTKLIALVSDTVRNTDPSARFGISPQARMDINYNAQYADIGTWVNKGYIDYICPQVYFGFDHESYPFDDLAYDWADVVGGSGVDLYLGLAVYKCGASDNYAGSGASEWVKNDDLLARMVKFSRGLDNYGGFVLYRYDSMFAPAQSVRAVVREERANLAELL